MLDPGACCSTGTADTYARTDPLYQPPAKACAGRSSIPLQHLNLQCLRDMWQGTMQGISEAAFSFANFVGPLLGSHVATSGTESQSWRVPQLSHAVLQVASEGFA